MKSPLRRAVTLYEMIMVVIIFSAVTVSTMTAVSRIRRLQGSAMERGRMALRAQEELDRIRTLPPGDLAEGTTTVNVGEAHTTSTLTLLEPGLWQLEVQTGWSSAEGIQPVRLATLLKGEQP